MEIDDERFDNARQKDTGKHIVLADGRKFSQEYIFNKLFQNGLREPYMKEALYRLLMQTPIKVEFSDNEDSRTIDVEKYFKRHVGSRKDYGEVEIEIDGISGDDPRFFEQLSKNGMSYALK